MIVMKTYLRFAILPWNRCKAYRAHAHAPKHVWGRCKLVKSHTGDHLIQVENVYIRWSTEITVVQEMENLTNIRQNNWSRLDGPE